MSGVLILALENSVKLISVLQRHDKEYIGVIHLHKDVSKEELEKVLEKFKGKIKQMPPRRSAVARKQRKREIYDIQLLDKKERNACIFTKCEAGTYIRVLYHDIGKALGTGAHMKELRRTRSGLFKESNAHKISDLLEAYKEWKENKKEDNFRKIIQPIESALSLKKIIVKNSAINSLVHGSPLYTHGISKIQKDITKNELIGIYSLKGEIIALATTEMRPKEMMTEKGLAAKINRVIMDKDIYPKIK